MVVIRLSRQGAKKRPFYHVVVADSRFAATGRFIEKLGFFNPIAGPKEERIRLNVERIEHWIKNGAQPSDRVQSIMRENELGPEEAAKRREAKRAAEKARRAAKAAREAAAAAEAAAQGDAAQGETA
ncbi:MAG: 30S ribosomal protein S16 [Succinivibrionaceae bacterium]|nr:30S ribosomal protein S16 [Succinivibrionaceae bacterium]